MNCDDLTYFALFRTYSSIVFLILANHIKCHVTNCFFKIYLMVSHLYPLYTRISIFNLRLLRNTFSQNLYHISWVLILMVSCTVVVCFVGWGFQYVARLFFIKLIGFLTHPYASAYLICIFNFSGKLFLRICLILAECSVSWWLVVMWVFALLVKPQTLWSWTFLSNWLAFKSSINIVQFIHRRNLEFSNQTFYKDSVST